MKVKQVKDQKIVNTATCGKLIEILAGAEYPALDLAVAIDIHPTTAHFHNTFDEIYFVLDGSLTIRTFDPKTGETKTSELNSNELCIIDKGIHHQIIKSSEKNRLCVIRIPCWKAGDEHICNSL